MHYTKDLPNGYAPVFTVDFEQDPAQVRSICIIALVMLAIFIPLGLVFVPLSTIMPGGFSLAALGWLLVKIMVGTASVFLYIILHELTHGVLIRFFSGAPAKYGHNGLMYAYAYSDGYFGKASYLTIALAPVALWTVLLAWLCCVLPMHWFWVIYAVQLTNLSGAADDIYVTLRFLKLPKDILTKDDGARMVCYSREENA